LAKGNLAVALALSQRFVDPYIKGGLPIKVLTSVKEGMGGSNGFGTVAIMANAPHPNATKSTSTGCSARKAKNSTAAR
jgi:hypothetical protein